MNIMILRAGSGVSHSIAGVFGKKGFSVILVARKEDKLIKESCFLPTGATRCIRALIILE